MNLPYVMSGIFMTVGAGVCLAMLVGIGTIFISFIDGIMCRPAELETLKSTVKEHQLKIERLDEALREQNRLMASYCSMLTSTSILTPNTPVTFTYTEGTSEKY